MKKEKVLILTPVKDAEKYLDGYFESIYALTYPHQLISVAFLESDSLDNTYAKLIRKLPELKQHFRSASVWKKDFGFHIPAATPRWMEHIQEERRTVLAKSRNHLLFRALTDEDWVLWLDVDVIEYPPDIIERLLDTRKYIVHPHCVLDYGGKSFDLNAWRDRGRYHMHDLRSEGAIVRLDTVGGTMLLVKADAHRDGLVFPSFPYGNANPLTRRRYFPAVKQMLGILLLQRGVLKLAKIIGVAKGMNKKSFLKVTRIWYTGEIETEGLGIMANDMGYSCWGMPNLEIRHARS
jgi:hypothetical protein